MALSDTRTKVVYGPNGTQVRYEIPFPLFDARDLECIAVDEAGRQTRITAFDVHDLQSESGPYAVFDQAPPSGVTLVIRRTTKPVHETEYPEGGAFPSRAVERDLSRITAMIQELNEVVDRSIKVNAGEEGPPESAEDLYLRITQIALAASDAVGQAGLSASAALEAAARAGAAAVAAETSGAEATAVAEAAAAVLAQVTGLGVRVVTKGCYDAPHGEYDAQSGTLVLYLPFCQDGGQGGPFLSDALNGKRTATEGVGASEWALAQVNAKAGDALFNSILPGLCHPFTGRMGGPDNRHPIDRRTGRADLRYALCDGGACIAPDGVRVHTPDLRDRFILAAGSQYGAGAKGGSASLSGTSGETTLTPAQMPAHRHSLQGYGLSVTTNNNSSLTGIQMDSTIGQVNTNDAGGGQSHSHDLSHVAAMPPYYTLAYIMAL